MEEHLKSKYGYNTFREYQKEIVSDLIEGNDVFALLPTGGGKSLLYQYPATFQKKTSIVLSPLISLMNDQCIHLNHKGIASICLNSESFRSRGLEKYTIIYTTRIFYIQYNDIQKDSKTYLSGLL